MIKWGRKKTSQTTSNVSLKTWSSKFKKMENGAEPESETTRFDDAVYHDEDISYNSDHRLNVTPVSSACFVKMVSNGRTMREIITEEARIERIKIKAFEDGESRKDVGSTEAVKKIVLENKTEITIQAASKDCLKSKSTIDNSTTRRSKFDSEEWQKLKNMKINEIMLKNEKQRKYVDVSKETHKIRSKQSRKVNAYTPRTLARVECRIKALEDMKKTRMKMNKKKAIKDAFRTCLDSFAIVKSSFDPRRDFRDSMIEMITENGIRQREELEELLACYLTLNCDEYHDLIVKVFKEVWLELNQAQFDPSFPF